MKLSHMSLPVLLIGLLISCSLATVVQAISPEQQQLIITNLADRARMKEKQIEQVRYHADSRVVITNSKGEIERTITSQRTVIMHAFDEIKNDYHAMQVDGRQLSQQEMEQELKQRKNGKGHSPFLTAQEMKKYRFTVEAAVTYHQLMVWKVSFVPIKPEKGLAVGWAYVDQASYDVVYMTFHPAIQPAVMKKMKAEIHYQKIDDYWMIKSFDMTMHLKVSFLLTLADQVISIQEKYSTFTIAGQQSN